MLSSQVVHEITKDDPSGFQIFPISDAETKALKESWRAKKAPYLNGLTTSLK